MTYFEAETTRYGALDKAQPLELVQGALGGVLVDPAPLRRIADGKGQEAVILAIVSARDLQINRACVGRQAAPCFAFEHEPMKLEEGRAGL